MSHRITLTAVAALLCSPAFADITADDVWANTVAFYAATGGALTADRQRDGDTVFVNDMRLDYTLPFDFVSVRVSLPPMTWIDQPDGTVTMIYPKSIEYGIAVKFDDEELSSFGGTISINHQGFRGTASGTPGAVTYVQTGDAYTIDGGVTFNTAFDDFGFSLAGSGEGFSTTMTLTEGDLILIEGTGTILPSDMTMETNKGFGVRSVDSYQMGASTISFRDAIPAEGVDLLNIAPALRAGMFFEVASSSDGSASESLFYLDDDVQSATRMISGKTETSLSLSEKGLSIAGSDSDIFVSFDATNLVGIAGSGRMDTVSANIQLPLLASNEPQRGRYQIGIDGLTLDDATWNLLDPERVLPRDAAEMNIDLGASVTLYIELLDFLNLESAFTRGDLPVVVTDITVDAFSFEGAGARVSSTGTFSVDYSEFPDDPIPSGNAAVTIDGAHTLLDNLIALGVLQPDDAFAARISLGMFTRDDGNGTLTSNLEINGVDDIRVNGERVK